MKIINGDIDLSYKQLKKLPELSNVKVSGGFYCYNNNLTSLEGAPKVKIITGTPVFGDRLNFVECFGLWTRH